MNDGATPAAARLVRFGFLLTDQFSLLAFTGFVDALRELEDHGALTGRRYCAWSVLGPPGSEVRCSAGIAVAATSPFDEAGACDYVVVVGGRSEASVPPAAVDGLRRAARRGATLVGLDTGTFVLARHGFLDRCRVCLHWFHHREFVESFPAIAATAGSIFVIDGARITCAGGTCTIDLAAHLIETTWGAHEATRALSLMGLDRKRAAAHFQTTYLDDLAVGRDAGVREAIQFMERRPDRRPSTREIARELGRSPRQLERAFAAALGKSPGAFSRQWRLRYGHWLVLHTERTISQIAFDCGFSDGSHFGRLFRREFGASPSDIRAQDRGAGRATGAALARPSSSPTPAF